MAYEDIVKGYEITPDRYVMIAPEELEAFDPKATRTIDIEEFVEISDIDPIYYDHNYYLAPTSGGAKAYRLLLDAMREAGKVGIGRVVLRSKQQLCALRPTDDVLTLTTMLFGDEVLTPDRIDELDAVADAEASDRELAMAQQLIGSLSADFDPARFHDEYRERVLELIEKKAAGEEIAVQPEAEEPAAGPRPDGRPRGESRRGQLRRLDDAPAARPPSQSRSPRPRSARHPAPTATRPPSQKRSGRRKPKADRDAEAAAPRR